MTKDERLHIFVLPFPSPSHIMSLLDMARLFAECGVRVSVVTTPANSFRFRRTIDEATQSGHIMDLLLIPFPSAEVGLPDGCEDTSSVPPIESNIIKFHHAINLLKQPFELLLHDHLPDSIISDAFYTWTSDLGIPRIIFDASSPFTLCIYRSLAKAVLSSESTTDEPVEFSGELPHQIAPMMRSELPQLFRYPTHVRIVQEAERKSYGAVANSFYELTPEYVDHYCRELGGEKRIWCLGPVWFCNKTDLDKAERGGGLEGREAWERIKSWLDSQDNGSVLYVCFGSEHQMLSHDQLREIALGLESSGQPFILVVKDNGSTSVWLPQGFEERLQGKGVIFRGWAPQLQILNHPAIGGFMTHCGWNSTIEAVSAGMPMIAWPLHSEQFINERLIVQVLGIGVRVLEEAARTVDMKKEVVKGQAVKEAVLRLMGDGVEAKAMQRRAKKYKEMARSAMEEGGSSRANLNKLIEELTVLARKKKEV